MLSLPSTSVFRKHIASLILLFIFCLYLTIACYSVYLIYIFILAGPPIWAPSILTKNWAYAVFSVLLVSSIAFCLAVSKLAERIRAKVADDDYEPSDYMTWPPVRAGFDRPVMDLQRKSDGSLTFRRCFYFDNFLASSGYIPGIMDGRKLVKIKKNDGEYIVIDWHSNEELARIDALAISD